MTVLSVVIYFILFRFWRIFIFLAVIKAVIPGLSAESKELVFKKILWHLTLFFNCLDFWVWKFIMPFICGLFHSNCSIQHKKRESNYTIKKVKTNVQFP